MLRAVSRFAGLVGLALAAWACSADRIPTGPPIESADDLVGALRQAGAGVEETARLPSTPGLTGGRVVLIGAERVEIFEFESGAERARAEADLQTRNWPSAAPSLWSQGRLVVVYPGSDGATIALLTGLLGEVIGLPPRAVLEPYPPAVTAAIAWLAEQQGVAPESIEVLGYDQAEWPDACLGAPQPPEVCALMVVFGWQVRLEVDGVAHTLRTDSLGQQIRLENR